MKKITLALTICLVTVWAACSGAIGSAFFSSFSLEKLVKNDKSNVGLVCDSNPNGGGGGSNGTSFGFGHKQFNAHKALDFACKLKSDASEPFDEKRLMAALQLDVEQALRDNGANVIGSGNPDPTSFYFAYTLKNIQGRVQVSGRITSGDYFSLQADLSENGK
jgi:hypothetical protein